MQKLLQHSASLFLVENLQFVPKSIVQAIGYETSKAKSSQNRISARDFKIIYARDD